MKRPGKEACCEVIALIDRYTVELAELRRECQNLRMRLQQSPADATARRRGTIVVDLEYPPRDAVADRQSVIFVVVDDLEKAFNQFIRRLRERIHASTERRIGKPTSPPPK